MRFDYSYLDGIQDELRLMPLLSCMLKYGQRELAVTGLVDSGAMVNVLPHRLGLELGAVWNEAEATLELGKAFAGITGMPLELMMQVGEFDPIRLVFVWAKSDAVRLVFGQANFFMQFDVHFYRSQLAFEINPKSST